MAAGGGDIKAVPNPYFPSALQVSRESNGVIFPGAFMRAPLPSGFDVSVGPYVQTLTIECIGFRSAFGCMVACDGDPANIGSTSFWMNRCRAFRTSTLVQYLPTVPSPPPWTHAVRVYDQDYNTGAPTVTATPQGDPGSGYPYPTGYDIFNDPNDDIAAHSGFIYDGWQDPAVYPEFKLQTATDCLLSYQNAYGGTVSTEQTLSNEERLMDYIDRIWGFLAPLNMQACFTLTPPTDVYLEYLLNKFQCGVGDSNDPAYESSLDLYSGFDCDVNALMAFRAAHHNFPWDNLIYPTVNTPDYLARPTPPGLAVGTPISTLETMPTPGLSCVRAGALMNHPGQTANGNTCLVQRTMFRTLNPIMVTLLEFVVAWGGAPPGSGTVWVKQNGPSFKLTGGGVFEIPQPTFHQPYVTHGGVAVSGGMIAAMNTSLAEFVAGAGGPAGGWNATTYF